MSQSFYGTHGKIFLEARQIAFIQNFTIKIGKDGMIRIHVPEIENYSMDLFKSAFERPLPYLTIHATVNGQNARIRKALIDKLTITAKMNKPVLVTNVHIVATIMEWIY
jgi:hypothetical protein